MTAVKLSDVQGNILKGFDKPNVRLIFFKFGKSESQTKAWLRAIAMKIPSTTKLMRATKQLKGRKRSDPQYHPQDVWLHVSLSKSGIDELHLPIPPSSRIYDVSEKGTTVQEYDDRLSYPFEDGMKARAHILGDTGDNSPEKWVEPFTYRMDANGNDASTRIDALFIVASDEEGDGDSYTLRLIEQATLGGAICVGMQRGKALENGAGKQVEHFGFRDGISQPLIKEIDDKDIKKRKINRDEFKPEDFVLYGLKGEHKWANNGSFLVFRRLRQDVSGFWESMNKKSRNLGLTPEELAAKFVGRWKSGAPLAKYPDHDPVSVDDSDFNDFAYCDNKQQVSTIRNPPSNDLRGEITPRFGHIRKANPRDDGRHEGAHKNLIENRKHRMLRRGMPYGVPWAKDPKSDRGLLFISFQRDIEEQFEYIQNLWANKSDFPLPDVVQEGAMMTTNLTEHGPDPMLGQHQGKGTVNLLHSDGKFKPIQLKQWVTVTGGEYFFSPSISALEGLRTKKIQSPALD